MSQERWLKRALKEMGPVPDLPAEYRRPRPQVLLRIGGKVCLYLVGAVCFFAIVAGRLGAALVMALIAVLVGSVVVFVYSFVQIRIRAPAFARVLEGLAFEGPSTARSTLDALLPDLPWVSIMPASDFLLEVLAYLEEWAGEHGRAAQLCRAALDRLPDPPDMRRVGSLVRSTIEALALDGQIEEAAKWLAWGRKYCPTEFAGKDWLTCAIFFARQGDVDAGLAALQREPDPLSTSARGQLVARAVRAFLKGAPEPLPLKEVRYLGSQWPEFASFLDDVERRMAAAEKASA